MSKFTGIIWILLVFFVGSTAWAGGAMKTNINGKPFHWEGTVVYNPDSGALKSGVYSPAESRQLITDAFATWANLPGVNLNIQEGGFLPDGGDTDASNYRDFFSNGTAHCYDSDPNTPCYSPIIFDEDGSILEDMFGECAQFSILGFAGFVDIAGNSDDPALTVLKKGQAIFSGACVEPVVSKPGCPPCSQVLDDKAIRSMILHELGHLLGMDHSQVNPDSYEACTGNANCPGQTAEDIPTMFPILVRGANQLTLHQDDVSQFLKIYGQPEQDYCTVTGSVLAKDGNTPLRGVEVVARNTDPSLIGKDAMSNVSGAESPRISAKDKTQGNCIENCGQYQITGLTPGETYQICVQRILSKFDESRAINPVNPPFQGVDNDCPEGLTVTCECPQGEDCPTISGKNIITSNTGVDAASSFLPGDGVAAAGCSLVRPPHLRVWVWAKWHRVLRLWGVSAGEGQI